MSFRNVQIDGDDLPRADEVELRALAPAYPREVLTQGLLTWGVVVTAATIPFLFVLTPLASKLVRKLPAIGLVFGALTLVPMLGGSILVPLAVWRARRAGYALRGHDLVFRRGLFFRKTIVLPFNRVQHAEVSSGPLQRRFGLASLKLYTAGASGIDLRIDGLTAEMAATLRDHVTSRAEAGGG